MSHSTEMLVFQLHACRYTALAGITVWVYDYLLTFTDELELLWSRNGFIIKALYLVGRYLPIAGTAIFGGSLLPTWQPHKSNRMCRVTFTILIFCTMIQSIVSMTIFTMRLCTVFVMRLNVRRFLVLSLVITLVCFFIFYGIALHHLIPGMAWNPIARTCVIPNYQTWALGAVYLTPIFMESVIFFSTIVHSIEYHRNRVNLRNKSTETILRRLYIDGTQYYGLVLALRIGSVCVFFLSPLALQVLFRYLEYLVSSTLTSRYFLSFRRTILDATESEIGPTTQGSSAATGSTSWRTKTSHTVNVEDGSTGVQAQVQPRGGLGAGNRLRIDAIDLVIRGRKGSKIGLERSDVESSVELRNLFPKAGLAGN